MRFIPNQTEILLSNKMFASISRRLSSALSLTVECAHRVLQTEAQRPQQSLWTIPDLMNGLSWKIAQKASDTVGGSMVDIAEQINIRDVLEEMRKYEFVCVCVPEKQSDLEISTKLIINAVKAFEKSTRTCFLAATIVMKLGLEMPAFDVRTILYLASKFEDVEPLTLENIQSILPSTKKMLIIEEERKILNSLNYEMLFSTPDDFYGVLLQLVDAYIMRLNHFKCRRELIRQIEERGMAFLKVGLYNYNTFKSSSSLAFGALYAAIVELFRLGKFAGNTALIELFKLLYDVDVQKVVTTQCSIDLFLLKMFFVYKLA